MFIIRLKATRPDGDVERPFLSQVLSLILLSLKVELHSCGPVLSLASTLPSYCGTSRTKHDSSGGMSDIPL